ncbi:MAG: glycosyltransferase [Rickettsiales bacterium]|jgi:glycosyltransferase involved in cell wall biosynthesis|nr:glycosyltransferase [Rickettsiales bacterium]
MKNKNPKVSVLTPIYNTNPEHLRQAVESILAQTFSDFEFIILNDSPENKELAKIVKSYKDPRVVYVENKRNIGISASRNRLLELARGEYLAIFDHDDISMPDRLEKEAGYLDKNPWVGVVSGNVLFFPKKRITKCVADNLRIKQSLMFGMTVPHTACMLRKSVLIDNGVRWEEKYSPAEDYMLMVRLIEHAMFHNFRDILVRYRSFEGNTTHRQFDKMRDADAMIKCVAYAKYPYLVRSGGRKYWLRLFGVPLVRIKLEFRKMKFYLFGFIPVLYIRG